ncbi:response regulator [Escherichia coli]|nr:response regulator [Escherichia coli]EFH4216520.1 response regulator [Escherichia coli]EFM9991510.1 response regulator [Escherichia coli]MHU54995.1 response regulator [Escherichia coli]
MMDFDPSSHPLINWAFGGVGATIVGWLGSVVWKKFFSGQTQAVVQDSKPITNEQNVNLNIYNGNLDSSKKDDAMVDDKKNLDYKKNTTKILFIDDEVRFKVVKILQKAGWVHTKLIKDADSIDQVEIREAKIIFVDIQGVGLEITPNEEGLGLALALKTKYPEKKIIIYSAEQTGDRFHKALREVDDFLPKDADPYQFQTIVESFA